MRIAYLIMTHNNPELLQRTIRTLSFGDPDCAFFVHVDRKTPFDQFSSVVGQNLHFIERIPVYWGEFTQVDAILSLIREAIASPDKYDYFVLITGACYPLRTGGYIRNFLAANHGTEYMDIVKVPAPGKPLVRVETIRYPSTQPFRRFVFRVLARLGLARRNLKKHLGGLDAYSGDGAWALTREACQYVLAFAATNPSVERFFRKTFAADETFFHTILGNSPFRDRMQLSLVYVDWSRSFNGHPEMLDHKHVTLFEKQDRVSRENIADADGTHLPLESTSKKDLEDRAQQQVRFMQLEPLSEFSGRNGNAICQSPEFLFARKFSDARLDIVDQIDSMIERKEGIQLRGTANLAVSAS